MYFSLEIDEKTSSKEDIAQALWALSQKIMADSNITDDVNMGPIIDAKGNAIGNWLLKK